MLNYSILMGQKCTLESNIVTIPPLLLPVFQHAEKYNPSCLPLFCWHALTFMLPTEKTEDQCRNGCKWNSEDTKVPVGAGLSQKVCCSNEGLPDWWLTATREKKMHTLSSKERTIWYGTNMNVKSQINIHVSIYSPFYQGNRREISELVKITFFSCFEACT